MASSAAEKAENEAMLRAFALALRESGLTEPGFAERLSYGGLSVSKDQVHSWKTRTTVPAYIFRRAALVVNRRMDELYALANGEPDTLAAKLAQLERQREEDKRAREEDKRAIRELRAANDDTRAVLERVLSALGQRNGRGDVGGQSG